MTSERSTVGTGSSVDVDTAIRWLRAMTARGLYSKNTGRMRATALEQLVAGLGPDDSRDAATVLMRLDELADLWARDRLRRPETASSYQRRARAVQRDFLSLRAAPGSFRPAVPPKSKQKSRRSKTKAAEGVNAARRDCPLGDGRHFRFEIPEHWSLADVERVLDHLATLAVDYRPGWKQSDSGPMH